MVADPENKLLHVTGRDEWRAWLKKNYRTEQEVWLVYAKKQSGKARIPYNDAVEEALCFGWIDSTVKAVDPEHFAQKFCARRAKSSYSQLNIERLRSLVEAGLVMEEILGRLPDLSEEAFHIPPDIVAAVRSNDSAWEHYQGLSPAYVRIRIAYIADARSRPEEFHKRLANFIKMTALNKRIGLKDTEKYY